MSVFTIKSEMIGNKKSWFFFYKKENQRYMFLCDVSGSFNTLNTSKEELLTFAVNLYKKNNYM